MFALLQTIPPYWENGMLLKTASPMTYVDAIKMPWLMGHGTNDPRVNQAESDQIVAAMKAKNIPVTHVLFPDEGHGFARPVNSIAFNAVAENFLQPCLGGRAEAIGDATKGSSIEVPEGAAYVPGLGAARLEIAQQTNCGRWVGRL